MNKNNSFGLLRRPAMVSQRDREMSNICKYRAVPVNEKVYKLIPIFPLVEEPNDCQYCSDYASPLQPLLSPRVVVMSQTGQQSDNS